MWRRAGGRIGFAADAFEAAAGREVEVGVRPEDLRFASAGDNALAFAGDFVEELGATRLFHGTSGDAPLVVAVAAAEAETAGTAVAADRFRRAPVRSRQRQQLAQVGVRPHAAAMKTTERASHGV